MGGWLGVKGVAWGPSEFPKPPWLGPERRPKTHRTGLFLIVLGWGYGGVDYKCSGSVFPEHLGNETQTIGLF